MVDIIPSTFAIPPAFSSGSVKLVLIPSSQVAPETIFSTAEAFPLVHDHDAHVPLDLSLKPSSGHHDLLRRSSSSSSASSSDSGFMSGEVLQAGNQGPEDESSDKKLKRREQNKAAAQAYRQRKKSISDLVETEYDLLLKKNVELLGQKAKLEGQIARMRQLLEHIIEVSKRQQEEQEARRVATEFMRSKSLCETSDVIRFGDDENYHSDADRKNLLPAGRSRQYSWPSDGSTCPNSKSRKKEQNRIASQRFRERRRRALSRCQEEVDFYQCSNALLKKRCEELESKIATLKQLLQKADVIIPSERQ